MFSQGNKREKLISQVRRYFSHRHVVHHSLSHIDPGGLFVFHVNPFNIHTYIQITRALVSTTTVSTSFCPRVYRHRHLKGCLRSHDERPTPATKGQGRQRYPPLRGVFGSEHDRLNGGIVATIFNYFSRPRITIRSEPQSDDLRTSFGNRTSKTMIYRWFRRSIYSQLYEVLHNTAPSTRPRFGGSLNARNSLVAAFVRA